MKMDWVISRLAEPSTWAGLATLLGGAAVFGLSTETWTSIVGVGMAVAGAVAAVKKDKGV